MGADSSYGCMRRHAASQEKVGVTPLTSAMAEPEAPDPEGQLATACHLNDVSSLYCITRTELQLVFFSLNLGWQGQQPP